jgi:hypothetical protein
VCNGSTCVHCGNDGELCCNQAPSCLGFDNCVMGTCVPPADMSMPTTGNDFGLMVSDMGIAVGGDMFLKPVELPRR